jgi:F-type H+/Na+-transporting ATPase subunit alpha
MDFNAYLERYGEVGFVRLIVHSLAYVEGLPSVSPGEVVVFESGELGQVLSIDSKYVEVLLLQIKTAKVGVRVARCGQKLGIHVGKYLLGMTIDPLGTILTNSQHNELVDGEDRIVDTPPLDIKYRLPVTEGFETGVSLVDLVVPLGAGQRQLVIGDRKTGKTQFLRQALITQAQKGVICVYAAIGKRKTEIREMENYFESHGIANHVVLVATESTNPAGLIFLTPYTAMTVAEYFRDQGNDVLIVLDDLTTQAQFYRQISLIAKRFPGRSSYPGDIFYTQSRLMERAGNFEKGSITCLPVAESLLGDLSGYIQTNIMSMTDGHLFFDSELFNQGKRPAINPFLSVTRVGLQSQVPLVREISRKIGAFLVQLERMQEVMHFGAELPEQFRQTVALGERINLLFDQSNESIVPLNASIVLLTALNAQYWADRQVGEIKQKIDLFVSKYSKEQQFRAVVDDMVFKSKTMDELTVMLKDTQILVQL